MPGRPQATMCVAPRCGVYIKNNIGTLCLLSDYVTIILIVLCVTHRMFNMSSTYLQKDYTTPIYKKKITNCFVLNRNDIRIEVNDRTTSIDLLYADTSLMII